MKIIKTNLIKLDIEAADKECAFFALYAGLRMYRDLKKAQDPPHAMSIAGAEAHCLLEQLKVKYPQDYTEAQAEFEEVYVEQHLKHGDRVVMTGCMEAEVYGGKVWEVYADSVEYKGEILVALLGLSGSFPRKFLRKVSPI